MAEYQSILLANPFCLQLIIWSTEDVGTPVHKLLGVPNILLLLLLL